MNYSFADVCEYKDKIYLFDNMNQALCEFSIISKHISILATFNEGRFDSYHIFADEEKIYITARQTLDFLLYEKDTGKLNLITSKSIGRFLKYDHIYDYHMLFENKLWSFPRNNENDIYYYDLLNNRFVKDTTLFKNSNLKNMKILSTHFSNSYENIYWKAFYNTNKYMKYDIKQGDIKIYELSNTEIQLEAICYDGKYLWMTSANNGKIVQSEENGKIIEIYDVDKNNEGEIFSRLYCIDSYIVGLPRHGNYILFIGRNDHKIEKKFLQDIDTYIEEKLGTSGASKILKCVKYEDSIIFVGYGIRTFIIMDIRRKKIKSVEIKYSDNDRYKILYSKIVRNGVVLENENVILPDFLKVIQNGYNKGKKSKTDIHEKEYSIYNSIKTERISK